ncbi:MAG: chemotaxis protein CheW [Planctomycetota bacterium]
MHDENEPITEEICRLASEALDRLEDAVSDAQDATGGPKIGDTTTGVFDGIREACAEAGCDGLAEAIEGLDSALRDAGGREHLHPSSVEALTDAITGTRQILESVSLGDLEQSLEPELIRALRRDASGGGPGPAAPASAGGPAPGGGGDADVGGDALRSPPNGFAESCDGASAAEGAFVAADPNTPLDPTGGGMPDPSVALDPTGGQVGAGGADEGDVEWGSQPLTLDDSQFEMLQFMVTDVRRTLEELGPVIAEAEEFSTREDAAARLVVLGDELGKLAEFFELPTFAKLVELLKTIGQRLSRVGEDALPELLLRMRALATLIEQYCGGLEVGFEQQWPLKKYARRIGLLLDGKRLHADLCAWHRFDIDRLLELDGVVEGVEALPAPESEEDTTGNAGASRTSACGSESKVQTIRVEKATFDRLLDIQRQLVLNKNFFLETVDAMPAEQKGGVSGILSQRAAEYARLTEQLRLCLDDTRVQPVGVLLERFERMVRDVASLGDREVDFRVTGERTPIDKFTIDRLADPLGRLLRHIAGHAIEAAGDRADNGKGPTGTLRVHAEHEGSHVSIVLEHDGEPDTADDILRRAQLLEHSDHDALARMSERELLLLPYRDWFSDSDLSGLMEELGAIGVTLEQRVTREGWTRIRLRMLVEGAVISVVSVRAGGSVYALPMQQIEEITPLTDGMLTTVHKRPAVSFRGDPVLLLDPRAIFADELDSESQHVVIVFRSRGARYAFRADSVLGSSEIVLERLGVPAFGGPFLGGAIRNDASIALVLDCERLPEFHPMPDGIGRGGGGDVA